MNLIFFMAAGGVEFDLAASAGSSGALAGGTPAISSDRSESDQFTLGARLDFRQPEFQQ